MFRGSRSSSSMVAPPHSVRPRPTSSRPRTLSVPAHPTRTARPRAASRPRTRTPATERGMGRSPRPSEAPRSHRAARRRDRCCRLSPLGRRYRLHTSGMARSELVEAQDERHHAWEQEATVARTTPKDEQRTVRSATVRKHSEEQHDNRAGRDHFGEDRPRFEPDVVGIARRVATHDDGDGRANASEECRGTDELPRSACLRQATSGRLVHIAPRDADLRPDCVTWRGYGLHGCAAVVVLKRASSGSGMVREIEPGARTSTRIMPLGEGERHPSWPLGRQ